MITFFFPVQTCTSASILEILSFIISFKLGLYVLKLLMSKQVKIIFIILPDIVAVTHAQFCENSFLHEGGGRAEMTFSFIAVCLFVCFTPADC